MNSEYFLYWLKGYLASKELAGKDLEKEDVFCILTALEQAIKSVHKEL